MGFYQWIADTIYYNDRKQIMNIKLLLTSCALGIGLVGCATTEQVLVPQYQHFEVVNPAPAPPLTLRNPTITAMSGKQMAALGSLSENSNKIFYVLTPDVLNAILQDDVDKFEFAQHEQRRAEFYKKAIEEYNLRVDQRNAEELKNAKKNK